MSPKPAAKPDASGAQILVTGFPSYLAARVILRLLETRPEARVTALVPAAAAESFAGFAATVPAEARPRLGACEGSVSSLDLGMTSEAYRQLVGALTEIQHVASRYRAPGCGSEELRRANVGGTQEVVELAGQCRHLARLVHWSTVCVSGTRQGVILEDELECGQGFHDAWERSRYEAERLVRRVASKLPVTVLRPGLIVGDARTGELLPYEGPHRLIADLVTPPGEQPLVLPGPGTAPVPLVPVDFVVAAGVQLAADAGAVNRTFHLVDPTPLPAHRLIQIVARKSHRRLPPQVLPGAVTRWLARTPRVRRLAPFGLLPPEHFDRMAFYGTSQLLAALAGTGLACPPFESYVERLIRFVREAERQQRIAREDLVADPLE